MTQGLVNGVFNETCSLNGFQLVRVFFKVAPFFFFEYTSLSLL